MQQTPWLTLPEPILRYINLFRNRDHNTISVTKIFWRS
ncbi:hypothetical protein NSP_36510 [Nodularia spumigena CCY9414]|nr:hypothetical protein NSP_36510 [Nodularia spumigena CCY9414]